MSPPSAEFNEQRPKVRPSYSPRIYSLVLLIVWVASAVYMGTHLMRGWVPHDEGAFAQSAERVLEGQLPHRDFAELYTGGLSFVHALAFRLLGINLATLRYVLFAAFIAWIPAVYYVASRFGSPLAAGGITLLCAAWSVPNYAAAVPSWYNLFLAIFGIAALLRYLEKPARSWIFTAGLCGGLSFVVKSVGLYYLAGVWLFLLFLEQTLHEAPELEHRGGFPIFRAMTVASVSCLIGLLLLLVRARTAPEELVHFVMPSAALGALLVLREFREVRGSGAERFSALAKIAGPFLAGILLPILVYLIPYIWGHALTPLFRGVFILPARRIAGASISPPPLRSLLAVVPVAVLFVMAAFRGRRLRLILTAAVAMCLAGVLWVSEWNENLYQEVWYSAANLIPIAIIAGVAVLGNRSVARWKVSIARQQQLVLLMGVLALCSIVQFPFSAAIYFCYVAPLLVLTIFAIVSIFERLSKPLLACMLVFYLFFAVIRVTPGFIYEMEESYKPDMQIAPLNLERARGLRIPPSQAVEYERLIHLVREHATGQFIYAAPDCPEVYFLAGFRNPTRSLFDFLDDSTGRSDEILNAIESHEVSVIVIYDKPAFSSDLPDNLRETLERRFPSSRKVGNFDVRWHP